MSATTATPTAESGAHSVGLPRAFGRYLLFDRIAQGGMAEIFLARATGELGDARRVVIKQILPELSQDSTFSELLIREAKLAAQLNHQNIVQVVDLGREDGRLFIAMAYVEGYDLNQLLRELSKRQLPLPAEFALLVVREVLTALDYAHRASGEHGPLGIVHRDVSPSNVLVSFEGEVSLCDFGIARAYASDASDGRAEGDVAVAGTGTGRVQRTRVVGKSAYMAPEHARGDEVDLRSDVFSVGILLWELCAGRRMYRGTEEEMLASARDAKVPPLPDRGLPALPTLQALLARALDPDPARRYQSAGSMLADLDDYALEAGLQASQLRFGRFLTEHFAHQIVALRREREGAARAAQAASAMPYSDVEPVSGEVIAHIARGVDEPIEATPKESDDRAAEPLAAEEPGVLAAQRGNRQRLWGLAALVLMAASAAYFALR
ncbi:MAG: serine/threonine-protein kinase [Myxococcales bacterium]|nr:serine/threonine-protein kinase [Myxococcales bacterium]MDD9971270.1 serine/threonine-protein kinase [Myxococcales bacterium]